MKTTVEKIPYKIIDYIKERFREDFLFEVKSVVKSEGETYYNIEVTKDDYIHELRFNSSGGLVKHEADTAFPEDLREERGLDPHMD